MGALLKFPIPSRGRYSCRELAAFESATVAGGRMVCITPQQGQNNPARITLIARHPRSIVVGRCANDNRFIISHPPFLTFRRELAGEGAAICANLAGLFLDFGALSRVVNFCRSLTGWSLPRVQPAKQPRGGFLSALRSFRGFVARFHEQTMNRGANHWNEKPFPNPTTVLPRMK